MKRRPRGGDLRPDRAFQRPGIRFQNILPDSGLRRAVAHAGRISGTGKLTNDQRVYRIMRKLKSTEINVIRSGVACVQELQLRGFGEDTAAVGSKVPNQIVQYRPFILPGVLIDLCDHKGHSEPFNETEKVLDRPVLEDMQPPQNADQTAPGRIRFFASLVKNKPVPSFLFRHPCRVFITDQTRHETIPQGEVMTFNGGEPFQFSAGSPDDFRR